MVEVSTKVKTHGERIKARADRVKVPGARPGIRVEPANEDLRRVLKHPSGLKFRSEGSVEWPDDQFTRRRLRDGSVKAVDIAEHHAEEQPKEEKPTHHQSHQSRRHDRGE